MSNLGTFTKQTAEVLEYTRDFTSELAATSAISVVSASVSSSPSGMSVSTTVETPKVYIKYSSGVNGVQYKGTLLTTMDNGLIYEDEFYINVENI